MSKASNAINLMPNAASKALLALGADLVIARQRRKESLKNWALRVGVSIPTLMRMEKGDPSVSMGVYATALWLMGRHRALAEMANPKEDLGALEMEIKKATSRHAPSRKVSVQAAAAGEPSVKA
jgi:hypothetical protein